jgi:hypothetical protein
LNKLSGIMVVTKAIRAKISLNDFKGVPYEKHQKSFGA